MRLLWLCLWILALGLSPAAAEPAIITGVREWHLGGGKSKRLRVIMLSPDGKFVYFHDGKSKTKIPPVSVDALIPEERAILADLHAGKSVLCKVPGLPMAPQVPAGITEAEAGRFLTGGLRNWQHANGKSIQARLVNLADDEVALLAGASVVTVALRDLSAADLEYVEALKRGGAPLAPDGRVAVLHHGWGGSPGYSAYLSLARYASMAERGSGFQVALDAALKEAAAKLPKRSWEFLSLEEHAALKMERKPAGGASVASPDRRVPLLYTATFALDQTGERAARALWPRLVTPRDWPACELVLHFTADGEILETEPSAK